MSAVAATVAFMREAYVAAMIAMRDNDTSCHAIAFCRDGSRGVLRLSSAPVRNASGEIIAGVVACDDVTDLVEAQDTRARLMAAEQTAVQMSQLVSNVSHELRTPVS